MNFIWCFPFPNKDKDELDEENDDLDSAENGESSEKPHGATNHAERRLKCHLEIYRGSLDHHWWSGD